MLVASSSGEIAELLNHGYPFDTLSRSNKNEAIERILASNINHLNLVCWYHLSREEAHGYISIVRDLVIGLQSASRAQGRRLKISISFFPDILAPFSSTYGIEHVDPIEYFDLPLGLCLKSCRHMINFRLPESHIDIPLFYSGLSASTAMNVIPKSLHTKIKSMLRADSAVILLCTRPWGMPGFHGESYDIGDQALEDILIRSIECVSKQTGCAQPVVLLKLDSRHSDHQRKSILLAIEAKYGSNVINLGEFVPFWCTLEFILPEVSKMVGDRIWMCSQDSSAPLPFLSSGLPIYCFVGCDDLSLLRMPSSTMEYISRRVSYLMSVAESSPVHLTTKIGSHSFFVEPII